MATRKGIVTTEFWLTLSANLTAAFLASGVLPDTHVAVKVAAFVAAALASLGYVAGRAYLKAADVEEK
jgi:hypothetical protein